jgi:hypothetical protein
MKNMRELLPPGGKRKKRSEEQIAAAAAFDYPATQVGTTGNITVSYDTALGAKGLALAQQFLASVTGPYDDMQTFFGITGGSVEVIIAPLSGNNDGSGGAYHYGCDFTSGGVLYLDATFANESVNPLDLEVGLYVAELSESFMGPQGGGWGCGFSNGEGLSRFCAEQETPAGTLDAFATGPAWAMAGFPDWVTKTEQTDQDSVSTGCAVVYIYWMLSQGFTIPQIVQAAGATLSANYQKLTGKATAYQDLRAAMNGLSITSDNPFPPPPLIWAPWTTAAQGSTPPGSPVTAVPIATAPHQFALFIADPGGYIYTASGNAQVGWGEWSWVAQGQAAPGAPVAALPWGQSFALFISDPNGGIYAIKAEPGFGWELVPGRSTKPGAQITAVPSGNRFTLFMADVNGEIFTTSGIPYQGWDTWTSVSEGSSTPGAPVAAVPWEDSFALFISDPNGGIYAIKAEPGFGWELVPGRSTKPGAQITAVPSGNRFTLFMADVNGEIFTTSGIPYQGWDTWTSVSEGSSTPGAPVAAVPWEDSFALFISDPNGGIYAIRAVPGFGWELVPGRSTKPGAQVTAVPWTNTVSPERFILFMADVNGEIFMTSGIPYQG